MNPSEIRESRRSQGISQLQLASMVGCSQPTISLIERQRIDPDPFLMRKITEVLAPEEAGDRNRHLVAHSFGAATAFANINRVKTPDPDLPEFLTIDQWMRPDFGGDLAVSHVHHKGRNWVITVVVVDLAGSGPRLMQSSAYLVGWIRGVLDSHQQPILNVIERLSSECRRLELDASAAGVEISGYDQRKGVDIDVVTAAFPPVLLVSDPPFRTTPIGEVGPALPFRESEYLSVDRIRIESGVLVINTDGLLERLGSGDQSAGRRALVKHLTSPKRHTNISDWLDTELPPRDDELAMVVRYRPWDIDEEFWVADDRERIRAQRSLERLLATADLSSIADAVESRAQLVTTAISEVVDNVRQHARGSGKVIVRAVHTTEFVRIEILDDGIGPPPARIVNDSNGGVFELIRRVADHMYVEEADPQGCLVGMVLNTTS